MFVIREVLRTVAQVVAFAISGRRVGLAVLVLAGVAALALAGAVTTTVPVAIYPFL